MRKRYRVLLLAAIVAAFVVPVGFALSLESGPAAGTMRPRHLPAAAVATTASAAVTSPVLVPNRTESAAVLVQPVVPDAAKLLIVGTVLFGLAAAVRKAI